MQQPHQTSHSSGINNRDQLISIAQQPLANFADQEDLEMSVGKVSSDSGSMGSHLIQPVGTQLEKPFKQVVNQSSSNAECINTTMASENLN